MGDIIPALGGRGPLHKISEAGFLRKLQEAGLQERYELDLTIFGNAFFTLENDVLKRVDPLSINLDEDGTLF